MCDSSKILIDLHATITDQIKIISEYHEQIPHGRARAVLKRM